MAVSELEVVDFESEFASKANVQLAARCSIMAPQVSLDKNLAHTVLHSDWRLAHILAYCIPALHVAAEDSTGWAGVEVGIQGLALGQGFDFGLRTWTSMNFIQ